MGRWVEEEEGGGGQGSGSQAGREPGGGQAARHPWPNPGQDGRYLGGGGCNGKWVAARLALQKGRRKGGFIPLIRCLSVCRRAELRGLDMLGWDGTRLISLSAVQAEGLCLMRTHCRRAGRWRITQDKRLEEQLQRWLSMTAAQRRKSNWTTKRQLVGIEVGR